MSGDPKVLRARRVLLWVRLLSPRLNLAGFAGALLLALVLVTGLAAPLLTAQSPNAQHLLLRLLPPGWSSAGDIGHPLGTDQLGRDILSRIIYGARVSLIVALTSVLLSGAAGVFLGLLAGFYGGRIDTAVMRLADLQIAFPFLLLAMSLVAVLGTGMWFLVLALGIANWVTYARVVRGSLLSLREQAFVEAARAVGVSDGRLLFRHILPNLLGPVIVVATVSVSRMIIAESSLSFLGLGVPPEIPSWGGMLSEGRGYIYTAWWLTAFPGLAIMLTVLGANFFGDGVRDLLDPQFLTRRLPTA
jgi:peptide/nickel transport system permease protein